RSWNKEYTSAKFQMRPRMAASPAIYRGWLREETPQDVIDQRVVFLLKARVRNPRHHRKMLIGIRQAGEEGEQILKARDAIPLAAHDQRGHGNFLRVHHREIAAHVDIGAGRHRAVQRAVTASAKASMTFSS